MADDEDFTKAFEGFGEDDKPTTGGTSDPAAEEPKDDKTEEKPADKKEEDNKTKEDAATDEGSGESEEKGDKSDSDSKTKENEDDEKAPKTDEAPQPLTKDDVQEVVSNLLNTERSSSKELENTTQEVLDAFYPEGLSDVLVDEKSGKELRTPADVVEASNGSMTTEEAAQWLLNEQFVLNKQLDKIRNDAKNIAETTVKFKRDSVAVIAKYEPLFKAYPHIQGKVYEKLMKQVKVDKEKGIILSAPDVMEHYDDYLEPYQQAYELGTNKAATNPVVEDKPEPPKPTAEDRMDEGGDATSGGDIDDPNDFAQQVRKELAIQQKEKMMEDNLPKGIPFFNIKSGDTHYLRLEAQIQAYINSSDMGINASRDQDFGWRLAPEWVKKVKAFRRNEAKMETLTARNGGQRVTTPQILYAIYGEQLRAAQERAEEEDSPFEEEYLAKISSKSEKAVEAVSADELSKEATKKK